MKYAGLLILGIIAGLGFILAAPADESTDRLKREIIGELEKKLDAKMAELKKDLLKAINKATKKPEPKGGIIVEYDTKKPGEKPRVINKHHKFGTSDRVQDGIRVIPKLLKKKLRLPEIECPDCGKRFRPQMKDLLPDIEKQIENLLRRLPGFSIEEEEEFEFPPRWRRMTPRPGQGWQRRGQEEDEKAPRGRDRDDRFRGWVPRGENLEGIEKQIEENIRRMERMLEEMEKALPGYEEEERSDVPFRRFGPFRFRSFPGGVDIPERFRDEFEKELDEEGEAEREYDREFDLPGGGKGRVKLRLKGRRSEGDPDGEFRGEIEIEKDTEIRKGIEKPRETGPDRPRVKRNATRKRI